MAGCEQELKAIYLSRMQVRRPAQPLDDSARKRRNGSMNCEVGSILELALP